MIKPLSGNYMAKRYNTGNSRPSNSMKDLNDNALAYDDFLNSEQDEAYDRFQKPFPTVRRQVAERIDEITGAQKSIEQYADEAKQSADNAQNIADANTYYTTPEDPDGTIAGVAGSQNGEMFRVAIQDSVGVTVIFNYYKNASGVAEFVNSEASKRFIEAIESLTKEPTALARNSLLYTGEGPVFPIKLDSKNNVVFGYDSENDIVIGAGIVNTKNISDIAMSNEIVEIIRQQIFLGTGVYPEILGRNNEVIFGYDSVKDTLVGAGLVSEIDTLRLASQNAGISFIVPIQAVVNQTLTYGQSLAEGANGKPAKSVIQPYSNITFSGGPRENMSGSDFSSFIPFESPRV